MPLTTSVLITASCDSSTVTIPSLPISLSTPAIVLPISLSDLQNSKINLYNHDQIPSGFFNIPNDYSETVMEINKKGEWSNFYRNATDHKGNKLGNHEVKAIRLETIKKYE